MTLKADRNSYSSVAVPVIEDARPQPALRDADLRAALESELRVATREYEDELQVKFDRLPKWISNEGGQVRHRYWNGQDWVEFDLNNPPLWVVENIDPDRLPAPGINWR